jgi:hypothetical protein
MDISKVRQQERITLLEEQMIDRCDEISEISFALLHTVDANSKLRYEYRLKELRFEMQGIWREYQKLITTKLLDIHF